VNSDVGSGNVATIHLSTDWEIIFIYRQIYWYSIVKKNTFYYYSVFRVTPFILGKLLYWEENSMMIIANYTRPATSLFLKISRGSLGCTQPPIQIVQLLPLTSI